MLTKPILQEDRETARHLQTSRRRRCHYNRLQNVTATASTRCWVSNTLKSQGVDTSAVQRSDTTDRFSSTRAAICPTEAMAAASKYCTNPSDTPSVQSVLGVGAMSSGAVPISLPKIQISKPTPFGGPTAWIEPPRRALAVRAAEEEIGRG